MENIIGIRFKLRIPGIPIDKEAMVLKYIKSVVDISLKLEFSLNKKHSSTVYHLFILNVAEVVVQILRIAGKSTISDAVTKRPAVARRSKLFGHWTY